MSRSAKACRAVASAEASRGCRRAVTARSSRIMFSTSCSRSFTAFGGRCRACSARRSVGNSALNACSGTGAVLFNIRSLKNL